MTPLDLQISDVGLVNFVFTKWLRPTYAGQKYAIFALNSLNLHRAPVPLTDTDKAATFKTEFVLPGTSALRRVTEERGK